MALCSVVCTYCSAVFLRDKYKLQSHNFCCKQCYYAYKRGEKEPQLPLVRDQPDIITLICCVCNAQFNRHQSLIDPTQQFFCSRNCLDARKGKLKTIECDYCHTILIKPLHRVRGKNNFCNSECYYAFKKQNMNHILLRTMGLPTSNLS